VPATGGLFLISFVTLFIKWSGNHLWSIIAFAMHQCRSTPKPRDGLYHQQQVLLRNNPNAFFTLWTLLRLSWRWKGKVRGAWRRGLLAALLPAANVIGIAAAAFFSSRLLRPTDYVLAQSDTCGWLADGELTHDRIYSADVKNQQSDSLWVAAVWTLEKSLEYTMACYESQSNEYSSLCSAYAQARIPSTPAKDSPCPFGHDACSAPAIRIDSGLIESGRHLGISSPPGETVAMRKMTTCAPVSLAKYESEWSTLRASGSETKSSGALDRAAWKYFDIFQLSNETVSFSNDSVLAPATGYTIE
jgi:hypothetical protein